MELQYESSSLNKWVSYCNYEYTHGQKSLSSTMLNNQNVHTTASFLISSKAQPILEPNNDLKIFHFTKMETEAKRREEVKWFVWDSHGQNPVSCGLR